MSINKKLKVAIIGATGFTVRSVFHLSKHQKLKLNIYVLLKV